MRAKNPVLVLQYPDPQRGRTVALAATRDPSVLQAFKLAVIEEANSSVLDRDDDDVLMMNDLLELNRLESVLDELIPTDGGD